MSDVKFPDLPGLAPDDEPDVYETEDPKLNEDSDQVLAELDSWQLAAETEPEEEETPAEKFHRLQLEFSCLKQEIYDLTHDRERGESADPADTGDIPSVSRLKSQLSACRISPLMLPHSPQSTLPCPDSVERLVSGLQEEVVYTLTARGKGSDPGQEYSSQLANLETELCQLEQSVGPMPATTPRLGLSEQLNTSLLPAVEQLQSRLNQLQPTAVKRCEPLLQLLHQKMNQLSDMRSSLDSINSGSQLEQLHELVASCDDADSQVDMVVNRLSDLNTLHNQALNFGELLTMMEESQTSIDGRLTSCEQELDRMRDGCYHQLSQLNQLLSTVRQAAPV